MNIEQIKYFLGKPCTVSTVAINWRFNVEPMMEYFVGILEKVDENGLLLTSTLSKCKSYIFLKHVVSISEEPVLYEDIPEDKKIIDQYRKEKPDLAAKTILPPENTHKFAVSLATMAKKAKEKYDKK